MRNAEFFKQYGLDKLLLDRVTNYQVDSRYVSPGTLFFAIKGNRSSGEDFLKQVADNKGICAFVSKNYKGQDFKLKIIKVADPLSVLQSIAKHKINANAHKIIAITGSVGKTTTKDFAYQLLEDIFNIGKSPGNANSQIGLPLSILNFEKEYDSLILEMGMTEKAEIQKLTEIACPEIALITSVGYAHAKNFSSLTKIAEAKAEIFTSKTKVKIADHKLLQYKCIKDHKPLTFSIYDKNADFYFDLKQKTIFENGQKVTTLEGVFQEEAFLHDLLAAIVIARQLGLSYENIQSKVLDLQTPAMRFEKIKRNKMLFINDTYNSNPISVSAALGSLKFYQSRKIAVIGPMLELGKYSELKHFEIGKLAAKNVDILFTIGSECETTHQAFLAEKADAFHFSDINSLVFSLKQKMKENDVILVKASRAIMLEKLFELI